jgi:hypothetical protein
MAKRKSNTQVQEPNVQKLIQDYWKQLNQTLAAAESAAASFEGGKSREKSN